MRYRGRRYQGARYRGKRRPSLLRRLICTLGVVLAGAAVAGGIYQRLPFGTAPSPPVTEPGAVTEPAQPPKQPVINFIPPLSPPTEPAVTVENTGGFELPVEGTHGIALIPLPVYDGQEGSSSSQSVPAGTPFTILREGEARMLARFQGELQGWVDKSGIMVNLPDLIPSMLYQNSNAEGSLMKNLGMDLEGITGRKLYDSKVYNEKLGQEQYIMPVQYHMAVKLMRAQQLAREQGLSIVLYEGFRPHDTQMEIAAALQQLAKDNADTRRSIQKNGFNISYYINTGISSHQLGSAVDVSLAQVSAWEERSFHGTAVPVPSQFTEFSSNDIQTGLPNGVQFASSLRYGPSLPEDTSAWMPTPMHELSYLSGTFTGPTKTYTAGAWRNALDQNTVQRAEFWTGGAQTLQDIFVAAELEPLASEWWHFNDLAAWRTASRAGASGRFSVGSQSFSMTPSAAAALGEAVP